MALIICFKRILSSRWSVIPLLMKSKKTIKEISTVNTSGLDNIPTEILLHRGNKLVVEIHHLTSNIWFGVPVPQVDTISIQLFKRKGSKPACEDDNGISLLEVLGKIFTKLLLNRLTKRISLSAIPENQCGFPGCCTMDMIFVCLWTSREIHQTLHCFL